jgi:peptidoglycan-associated lipoprotein
MRLPIVIVVGVALGAFACGNESPPPRTANQGQGGVSISSAPASGGANGNKVSMSTDLRHVCGIEDTGAAPKFDFDSALLSPTDRSELDQLAQCMTTGALAGKKVELVGRADPRGEAEYNMNLGAIRANSVKLYLAKLGVASTRFETTSRGSMDASGHDEASWAVDRRVDLRLAGQ